MSENATWIKTEVKEIIIYLFIGLFLCIVLPYFAGFVLRGFEENLQGQAFNIGTYLGQFIIYIPLIILSLFLIIFPIARLAAGDRKDHPATRKKPNWLTVFSVSLIHSPEENGLFYRAFHSQGNRGKDNPMRWSLPFWRNLVLAFLIFGLLGIVQVIKPQIAISGVPQTAQQITAISDVLFGAGVPSFAENGWLYFTFFLGLGIIAYFNSKLKGSLITYYIFGILLCFVMGALWMGYHRLVYGSSEAALFATYIFGTAGSFLTLATGTFIYWLVWHLMNNLILKILPYVEMKEDLILILAVCWFVLLISYISAEIYLRNRRKEKAKTVIPT